MHSWGWESWMTSLTPWTRVWVNSGSWGWTRRPGVLQSMGSQIVRHDWATELNWYLQSLCFSANSVITSVTLLCPTLCDPMDCSTPGLPVYHHLPEFAQTHVHQVMMPSNHLILCCPLLLPPSIFPSIRVFSNESVHIRWQKYWSFSFSISPSNEYSGLISFRIDWLDLLAVQGTLKTLL